MYSLWHDTTLGAYNPEERWLGLDYTNLLFDPIKAELTWSHEVTHYVLCKDTDFGQATEAIYQFLPVFKHITEEDKKRIKIALRKSQLLVQEGTASLMEVLHLKRLKGKTSALSWAREYMHPDYLERFKKLSFACEYGDRYRDYFTSKIPHTAMRTGIRKKIAELDLLSSADKFIAFLNEPENKPDDRYQKMIDVIRYKTFLVTKPESEICEASGINFVPDIPKEDVADFLTYLFSYTDSPRKVPITAVSDPRDAGETMISSFEDMFVANMNINLSQNGIFLWETDELLGYSDVIGAVLVSRLDEEAEWKKEIELLKNRKYDIGLIAFLRTGEKLTIGLSEDEAVRLINNELSTKSLLVKWGLYLPDSDTLQYFPKIRLPNVTIYNSIKHLKGNFEEYFKKGRVAEYSYLAVEKHPFHSLVLKDDKGVLHWVNTYGNKFINDFISENISCLKRGDHNFLTDTKHYNATLSVWMGFPWGTDWYKQFRNEPSS